MKPDELRQFLNRFELHPADFADLIGVTHMAVINWLSGARSISLPLSRTIRLFERHPELMKEFAA
jgi:DNA-binding transcriptional regulator YiaG